MHAANAVEFGAYLKSICEEYQVAYIELDQDIEIDKVCDIFTQINSRGTRLDAFDLINALLKPKGIQLKQMWREAELRLEFVEADRMNVYILQVMSILEQAYCSPKYLYYLIPGQKKMVLGSDGTRQEKILVPDVAGFTRRWHHAVSALEYTIKLLRHPQEFGVVSPKYLPYASILPGFAALQARAKELEPEARLDAQRKIRLWYWASVFTNRYSGAVESTTARDFLDVQQWIQDDTAVPSLVHELVHHITNLDLERETKRGTSVYNGVFNLLVMQGARDWYDGTVPQHEDLDDHHIVPHSWGKEAVGDSIHTILNRTPLTAETNRNVIGDRLPNQYLPELINRNGSEKVHEMMQTHFISPEALKILLRDPFTPQDFEAFITERQKSFRQAIASVLDR